MSDGYRLRHAGSIEPVTLRSARWALSTLLACTTTQTFRWRLGGWLTASSIQSDVDDRHQLVLIEGLPNIRVRADFARSTNVRLVQQTRHDDDGHIGVAASAFSRRHTSRPSTPGIMISSNTRSGFCRYERDGAHARGRGDDLTPGRGEPRLEELARRCRVVYDDDLRGQLSDHRPPPVWACARRATSETQASVADGVGVGHQTAVLTSDASPIRYRVTPAYLQVMQIP